MKNLVSYNLVLWASVALGFPGGLPLEAFEAIASTQANTVVKRQGGTLPTFNAKEQLINVHGEHKFVPPDFAAGDPRGPCPGLNALANHGYLPHSGVGTIEQFTQYPFEILGLGADVSAAVAVFGAVMCGDGLTWSIGGPPPSEKIPGLPSGLLSPPTGISFSHNVYEGDASSTRPDLYVAGNDYKLHMPYFKSLYDQLPADSFDTLIAHRQQRVQQSVATNPYYFSGPFTGIVVTGGANSFIWRLAANHSAEYPNGYLSKETFSSFWSVHPDKDGELYWKPGWDRIPENWYRRPLTNAYNAAFLGEDLATYFSKHPDTARIGGNTGKTNSFVGIDVGDLTGGVFSGASLAQGNNAACFSFQAAMQLAPAQLSGLFKDITGPLAMLEKAFGNLLAPLNCPQLKKLNTKALNRYPGYTKLKKGGHY